MSVIRWLVMQEVCRRFEFARHFESHLAQPPPFICACEQRFPMNIPLLLCYAVPHIIFSTYSFKRKQGNEPQSLFSIFTEKRLLRWDSNPRPPAFKAVALPTEPPRQPSWLGSNHTSYAMHTCVYTHTHHRGTHYMLSLSLPHLSV